MGVEGAEREDKRRSLRYKERTWVGGKESYVGQRPLSRECQSLRSDGDWIECMEIVCSYFSLASACEIQHAEDIITLLMCFLRMCICSLG
jgi:hypothetical protein